MITEITPEDLGKLNIHQRILAVKRELNEIQFVKDGHSWTNTYIKKPQLIKNISPLLLKYGINFYGEQISQRSEFHSYKSIGEDKKGNPKERDVREWMTFLDLKYHFVNADDPKDEITALWQTQGRDEGEKGPGRGSSYAIRNFLIDFFQIAAEDNDSGSGGNSNSYSKKNKDANKEEGPKLKEIRKLMEEKGWTNAKLTMFTAKQLNKPNEKPENLTDEDYDKILKELKGDKVMT